MTRLKIIIIMFVVVAGYGLLPTASLAVMYDVVYARSLRDDPHTETVISVQNTTNANCYVKVLWTDELGTNIDISGTVNLAPEETAEFTSLVGGGPIQPYILNVWRNGLVGDFEGQARVISQCQRLGVNAILVFNIDPNTDMGQTYTSIKVIRPQGTFGD